MATKPSRQSTPPRATLNYNIITSNIHLSTEEVPRRSETARGRLEEKQDGGRCRFKPSRGFAAALAGAVEAYADLHGAAWRHRLQT